MNRISLVLIVLLLLQTGCLHNQQNSDHSKKSLITDQNKSLKEWNQIEIEQASGEHGKLFLGMTFNELYSLDLYNSDFQITSTVELDDGKTAIWTPVLLMLFNTDGILYRITVNGEISTPIGIKNGDSVDLLENHLGKSDTTYKSESSRVEEYNLRDSYFYADISEETIILWSISNNKYDNQSD
ncbi:hypothetical protein [Cohnella terricola]|uniref:Lipoprotein n=1 Tax=Cohnella terricola TaxID=1289167 RepID=A0A559J8T5_9BACL|nr:hypothetical protein [Cohnella terricola]TVX96284.1 hypothetical protein FPZ45_21500 [Cohnella terricola]